MRGSTATIVLVAVYALSGCLAAKAAPSDPFVLVAYGDSFTQAADFEFGDQPHRSWATGTVAEVQSVAERWRSLGHEVVAFNAAKSGARMDDLPRQVSVSPEQVDAVLVLLGINDVCRPETNLGTFEREVRSGFDSIQARYPDAAVLVYAVPDLQRLGALHAGIPFAEAFWAQYDYCRPFFDPTSPALGAVGLRGTLGSVNDILRAEALAHGFTWSEETSWPGLVVEDLSPLDYFHPIASGQAKLADAAWRDASRVLVEIH